VNHFQAMLGSYAAEEGRADQTIAQNRESQKGVAEQAILNIFLSQSEFRDTMAAGFDISRCPASVVPAGVRSADLRQVVADDRLMPERLEDGTRKIVFVTAGRFSDYIKGGDLIYRAFTYLHRSNPNVYLLVISNSRRFSSILRDLPDGAYKIVDWLPRPQFLATLAAADVVAVPSRYESFGLVAVEAMMLGKPVIANNVGGLQEIIHHGRTGILNDLREGSYGLYRAMKLFADNDRFRTEVGEAARRYAEREFDLDRVADLVQKSLDAALMRNRSLAAACPYY
jgi:glycogen synthase